MKPKYKLFLIFVFIFALLFQPGLQADKATTSTNEARPADWAVKMERDGLPNLHKVSDALYRGAQPQKKGFAELKKMGIKTIVNMRSSKKYKKQIKASGINYIHIKVRTWKPKKKDFQRFLDIVTDPKNQPVFLHCKHGADRTGTASALYRIKVQKWDVEKAIEEMEKGGYNFHSYFTNLKPFIRSF